MAKPDPALLDLLRYPFACRIETRFGDIDVNNHINNVALAAILEEARVRFQRASGYCVAVGNLSPMVASQTIEYLGEGTYPELVDVYVAIEHVGRTSVGLVTLAQQDARSIAFSRAVMVAVGSDGPAVLQPDFLAGIREWMLRP